MLIYLPSNNMGTVGGVALVSATLSGTPFHQTSPGGALVK